MPLNSQFGYLLRSRGIIAMAVVVLIAMGIAGFYYATRPRFVDVDAMASRMKSNQKLYQDIRDEALDDYAKRNPNRAAYDDKVKTVIRIFAYLIVWGDFYGEGLWQHGEGYVKSSLVQGASDPLLLAFLDLQSSINYTSNTQEDVDRVNQHAQQFQDVDYPAAFKLKVCEAALSNLAGYLEDNDHPPGAQSPMMQNRYYFVERWGGSYKDLLKKKLPHAVLYSFAEKLQFGVEHNEDLLNMVIAEQERDFNAVDPTSPLRLELDGNYFVVAAWGARGGNVAPKVSKEGWSSFDECLAKGSAILEPLYNQYPDEVGTCSAMMRVELGQGQGRDRFELWFQRAIKADPDNYSLYEYKELYLQPRWHGSVEDIMKYGRECVGTGNWPAKLPMVLTKGVRDIADFDLKIYTRPDIWPEVEKDYRDYLDHYPLSIDYRTSFAQHAYEGGHRDIAREQLKILGDDWDRNVISDAEYATMVADLNAKP